MGVLLTEGGLLYGGDDINDTVDTINIATGAATVGPHPSSFPGAFYGLAPNPVPVTGTATPEPTTCGLLGGGITALALFRRRLRRRE
jgi:hypothetical protein